MGTGRRVTSCGLGTSCVFGPTKMVTVSSPRDLEFLGQSHRVEVNQEWTYCELSSDGVEDISCEAFAGVDSLPSGIIGIKGAMLFKNQW